MAGHSFWRTAFPRVEVNVVPRVVRGRWNPRPRAASTMLPRVLLTFTLATLSLEAWAVPNLLMTQPAPEPALRRCASMRVNREPALSLCLSGTHP
jgi:hypothetical protein